MSGLAKTNSVFLTRVLPESERELISALYTA